MDAESRHENHHHDHTHHRHVRHDTDKRGCFTFIRALRRVCASLPRIAEDEIDQSLAAASLTSGKICRHDRRCSNIIRELRRVCALLPAQAESEFSQSITLAANPPFDKLIQALRVVCNLVNKIPALVERLLPATIKNILRAIRAACSLIPKSMQSECISSEINNVDIDKISDAADKISDAAARISAAKLPKPASNATCISKNETCELEEPSETFYTCFCPVGYFNLYENSKSKTKLSFDQHHDHDYVCNDCDKSYIPRNPCHALPWNYYPHSYIQDFYPSQHCDDVHSYNY
jgi:hypothetical protein